MALGTFGAPSNPTRGTYGQATAPATPSGWNSASGSSTGGNLNTNWNTNYGGSQTGMQNVFGPQLPTPGSPQANVNQQAAQTQQSMDMYGALYGPDMQAAQAAKAGYLAQQPMQDAYYGNQAGYLRDNANLANQYTDLSEQGTGIDRNINAADRAYWQNMSNAGNQLIGNQGERFNNTQNALQQQAATNVRDTNSASTAAGNWLMGGRENKVNDIFGKYNTDLTGANLDRRDAILNLNQQQFRYDKGLANADSQDQKLDLLGKQYGLDRTKTQQALDQGLANLGYKQFIDGNDLMNKINSSNAQEAAVARQVLQAVMQSGHSYNSGQVGDYLNSFGVTGGTP